MLLPRFRPQYPGGGLPAFIVVAFVFFFGMLTAVEVFGAEEKEGGEHVAETTAEQTATTTQPTTTQQATTAQATTTTAPKPQATTNLKAGKITFDIKNDGKIQHDLAIKGMSEKTKLISAGGSAQLTVTLKPGTYDLYCSVAGHEQAGRRWSGSSPRRSRSPLTPGWYWCVSSQGRSGCPSYSTRSPSRSAGVVIRPRSRRWRSARR